MTNRRNGKKLKKGLGRKPAFPPSEHPRQFCHDCLGEVISEPVLCEDCVTRRGEEGMSRDDWRTLEDWMKT